MLAEKNISLATNHIERKHSNTYLYFQSIVYLRYGIDFDYVTSTIKINTIP